MAAGTSSRAARREAERRQRKAANAAARIEARDVAAATAADGDPAPEPAFFFRFAVPRAKLAFARFWIFGLLAVDAFLQLRHVPRYGAGGGFNVDQVPFVDVAAPTRVAVGVVEIVLAYLFAAIALGVGSRITVALAAALYAWVYFSSQLDSYQHHYLIALVLGLSIAVPWFRSQAEPVDGPRPVRSWALRVILIQLSILYLWAAIAKLDTSWLDGSALRAQLSSGAIHDLIAKTVGFRGAALMVLATELFLSVALWIRPLWRFALPLGVALHVGIAFTSLEIGLFSWHMVALYLLVIPDAWFVAIWRVVPSAWLARVATRIDRIRPIGIGLAVIGVALPIALGLSIEAGAAAAIVAGGVIVVADAVRRGAPFPRPAVGLGLVVTACGLALLAAHTTVIPDYYRLWGGASRRLGDPITARYAYGRMVELAPDEPGGHYQLGKLLVASGPPDDARGKTELHRAAVLWIAQAADLAKAHRRPEALAKLQRAREIEPDDPEIARLAGELHQQGTVPAPAPAPDDDDEPGP